jgi:hypothetical protein
LTIEEKSDAGVIVVGELWLAPDDDLKDHYSPVKFDPVQLSCGRDLPGPAELGAINPEAVHDHGQPTR